VQSGLAQVKALEAAEASTKLALEATQLGYKVGVRVNLDVLNAQTSCSTPSATCPRHATTCW
jgi:outer membrane protein